MTPPALAAGCDGGSLGFPLRSRAAALWVTEFAWDGCGYVLGVNGLLG
jgi:hypothetical protein